MYGLVPYNLSPIQQGIQYGHAVVEYGLDNFQSQSYLDWAKYDKTFIILNGGTTNKRASIVTGEYVGSLNNHLVALKDAGVVFSKFEEPDLGDQLTAVVFLVDERVFNKKKYPDFEVPFSDIDKLKKLKREGKDYTELDSYKTWKSEFGDDSDTVVFLRDFLKQFRLA
jgi:hypothetical protein